nr:HAMP domain-containing sensor histidine kinase [Thermoanaerobaculia bacterium]
RGIRLRYVGESPLLAPLREGLLSTVVKNLLDNAIDAGRRGGLIEYGGWLRSSCFELRVTDDGEGMSQGVLARATEPFFTTKATGTGLGLALVQRIVERSGGSVSLWSQPGHGTEVLIRQPLPESGC